MNVSSKPNAYSQATLLPIPMAQTVGSPYGYAGVPMVAYQQQIMAPPQQMWPSKTTTFNTPSGMPSQHPNGGVVCILPENMACLTVDSNVAATSTSANQSSCVYGIYYGGGSGAPSAPGSWATMEATNMPHSYFVQQSLPLCIAEMQRPQQMTPPMTPQFAHQTPPTQISYLQPAVNVQSAPISSHISYAAAPPSVPHSSRVHKNAICRHFLAGRCNRRNCRFLHVLDAEVPTA